MRRIQPYLVLPVVLAVAASGCSTKSSMVPHTSAPAVAGTQTLYVANYGNNDILEFPVTASGNVGPATTIGGGATQLNAVRSVAVNAQGQIFSNAQTISGYFGVAAFAPTASGNVAPVSTLAGSAATLDNDIQSLTFGSTGELVAADYGNADVAIFGAGATGNTAPVAAITVTSGAIASAVYATVDAAGKVYVVNNDAITILTLSGTGAVASSVVLNPPTNGEFGSVTVGPSGLLYATDSFSPIVYVYAAGASGNAAPIQTITGGNTGLSAPRSIALDATGRIYVSNDVDGFGNGVSSILVFAAAATGNVAPLATITGTNTTLNGPAQITIH